MFYRNFKGKKKQLNYLLKAIPNKKLSEKIRAEMKNGETAKEKVLFSYLKSKYLNFNTSFAVEDSWDPSRIDISVARPLALAKLVLTTESEEGCWLLYVDLKLQTRFYLKGFNRNFKGKKKQLNYLLKAIPNQS